MNRKEQRKELQARWVLRHPDPNNSMRASRIGRRRLRREVSRTKGIPFRPVLGHGIPAPNHKAEVARLRCMNRVTRARYIERLAVGA